MRFQHGVVRQADAAAPISATESDASSLQHREGEDFLQVDGIQCFSKFRFPLA